LLLHSGEVALEGVRNSLLLLPHEGNDMLALIGGDGRLRSSEGHGNRSDGGLHGEGGGRGGATE
jgi:hypothetical protein